MAPSPLPNKHLLLLASLFLWELSITVMLMAIYMKGDRPFAVFLSSNPGVVFLVTIAVSLIAGAVIIHQYLASKRSPSSRFSLIVMMNLVTVIVVLMTGEITIQKKSVSSIEGETLFGTVLRPKDWDKVALYYREITHQASGDLSYLVNDDLLGWTVGPNKQSADALYSSDSNGIRAPHAGITFAKLAGKTRIALMGDSFTFGHEKYEDTWGYLLEEALGSEFQVLNFGVGGYGVDQVYLRYEKDVRKWNPKIVIYGVTSHALIRTMIVYPFVSFPNWNSPFSKPRFILRAGELKKMNVPALAPEAIFSKGSISELPFLEYDYGYKQSDWEKSLLHHSYLARLFVSRFPRWSAVNPDVSDEALASVNVAILKAFVRSAAQSGTIPLVVYFPNFATELGRPSSSLPLGKRVLQEANIAYTDLTPCLLELNAADRFVPSGHYFSPQGIAAVANCLRPVVNEALAVPIFGS
jgi:hypothetical protein